MNIGHPSLANVPCYLPSKAFNGYTLFSPMGGTGTWLIDMHGRFVHHWEVPIEPAGHAVLLPNGHLLFAGKLPDPPFPEFGLMGGTLMEFDWNGETVWEYKDPFMHHDFQRLPNGNTLVLRWVETPAAIARRIKGGIPGSEREGVIWTDGFREITPEGKIAWEWLGYEHLDPESDSICPLCSRAEWTHANACFGLRDGNILTSFLALNTIAIIDRGTGKIIWRWGTGELGHQHDPSMLENGNILIFDNGAHRPSSHKFPYGMIGFSRVLEIDPRSNEIVWEYKDECPVNFNSSFISGCQRLPNGNTLICNGSVGRFFEVTREKERVWEYVSPFYFKFTPPSVLDWNNTVFRSHRYAPDYPGLKGKTLDPERVELTLRKKAAAAEEGVAKRLRHLGY